MPRYIPDDLVGNKGSIVSTTSKLFAALLAVTAWADLAVQLLASDDLTGSIGQSLWAMFRYFTVITNLIVAVVFSGFALGYRRPASAPFVSGVILAILLVVKIRHLVP